VEAFVFSGNSSAQQPRRGAFFLLRRNRGSSVCFASARVGGSAEMGRYAVPFFCCGAIVAAVCASLGARVGGSAEMGALRISRKEFNIPWRRCLDSEKVSGKKRVPATPVLYKTTSARVLQQQTDG